MQELDNQQIEQVAGGRRKRLPVTTLAIGEEGGTITTLALGEEGPKVTTLALGEEGSAGTTTAPASGSALGAY